MPSRTVTSSRRAGRTRTSYAVTVPAGLLALTVLAGCSSSQPAAEPSPGTATTASPTPTPSSTPSPTPSQTPTPTPSATATPSSSPPRTQKETSGPATASQVVGLVRIVATTGSDGSGETSTGMVLSDDGEVVTNNHAVRGATAVRATVMSTGRTYDARVVAGDAGRDVALLRLSGAAGLRTVSLAPRDAEVGDPVAVVGDAKGSSSSFTAITGTLLARGQTLQTADTATARAERLTGVILTSCDVVLGVSGGPTYDANGQVVGMTTASVSGKRALYGVSIPVDSLRATLRRLGG